jgi:DNA-binding transcriptional ArsR family regulator
VEHDGVLRAADLLKALASSNRLRIVLAIEAREHACVHELVDELALPQPLVSQHLRVLRQANVIAGERHGREIRYRIADIHVVHIVHDTLTHASEGSA